MPIDPKNNVIAPNPAPNGEEKGIAKIIWNISDESEQDRVSEDAPGPDTGDFNADFSNDFNI